MFDIYSEVIERLQQFGYRPSQADGSVIFVLRNKTIDEIKNICNIDKVPYEVEDLFDNEFETLKYKVVDKICAELLLMKLNTGVLNLDDIDISKIDLKSVTEGDTSVTYATDGGQSREQTLRDYLTKLSTLDKEELYKYRKMEW